LFRRDAMMIWLMRATEKDGDGTLDHAIRRIVHSLSDRPKQEKAPAHPGVRYSAHRTTGRRVSLYTP
jgi:hypothetical protein